MGFLNLIKQRHSAERDKWLVTKGVALAWAIRSGQVIAIPESGNVAHVKENAVALSLDLTSQELEALDAAHSPPSR
jgi:diketogulonate reductase-like aldo/keto reductase